MNEKLLFKHKGLSELDPGLHDGSYKVEFSLR